MQTGSGRQLFTVGVVVFAAALLLAALWAWGSYSARQSIVQAQRARNLKALYVAMGCYADKHGGLPPAHTTNGAGKPMQSWRVLLLPYLDRESLYSKIDLNEPWDGPANRRLLELMPEYYQSPLEAETHGTATNYFAVVGPHAPWWNAEHGKPWNTADSDEIMLIELTGLKTPWMEPRDPTLEELLDMLRPENGNRVGGDCEADIMYLTVHGDVRTVAPKTDRESLRKLLLGRGK